jgi:hypothetical protein
LNLGALNFHLLASFPQFAVKASNIAEGYRPTRCSENALCVASCRYHSNSSATLALTIRATLATVAASPRSAADCISPNHEKMVAMPAGCRSTGMVARSDAM